MFRPVLSEVFLKKCGDGVICLRRLQRHVDGPKKTRQPCGSGLNPIHRELEETAK
jgi:hypothetical protein